MGMRYKVMPIERKILNKVVCDKCGKTVKKQSEGGWNQYGEPMSMFHEPSFDCFYHLKHSWGYGSNKDGQNHEAVLCEPCYDEVFKKVKIKVTHYL